MSERVNTSYIIVFVLLFLVLYLQRQKKRMTVARMISKNRKSKANGKGSMKIMADMLRVYIGKKCTVSTLNDSVTGTIVAIEDGWMKIDTGKDNSAVNLDYVLRVRQLPVKDKNK